MDRSFAEFDIEEATPQSGSSIASYVCGTEKGIIIRIWAFAVPLVQDCVKTGKLIKDVTTGIFNVNFYLSKEDSDINTQYVADPVFEKTFGFVKPDIYQIGADDVIKVLDLLGANRIGMISAPVKESRICEKCGAFDDYACFNSKYKQVRCYMCCQ